MVKRFRKNGEEFRMREPRKRLKTGLDFFRIPIIFACLLIFALGLTGCTQETSVPEKGKPVESMTVEAKEVPVKLEYFGITGSQTIKKYSFKVPGKLSKLYIEQGQKVEKGKLLAELDKKDLQFALQAAEYTMNKASSAASDAQSFYAKAKILKESGAISQRDLDLALLDLEVKEASYNQAKVDYDYKRSMLNDAVLYADMDCFVAQLLNEEGEMVGAGYPVIIVRSDQQVVNVGLTQEDIQKVKKGTKAIIFTENGDNKQAGGEVTLLNQLPDQESRTYNVEIILTDVPDNYDFYLGSTCRVQLETGTVRGIRIPLTSIQNDGQDYVYIIKENRALRKNVKIIDTVDTLVRVEGLEEGEELIIAGMKNLTDGCLVVTSGEGVENS
jgi:RND family efflux transporter MFP subunit